ncbi:MAG: Gfo/Idh/MocA family oxidoreductase [Planctomycetales bacterium]|nr:Gfo/Idh/MocA family oxidoreductase [Planctomycetales bacterium]
MDHSKPIDRRGFLEAGAAVGTALGLAADVALSAEQTTVRVGVIGCGSVSRAYLPHLAQCPYVKLVSVCDIIPERAKQQAEEYKVPNQYPNIDAMLAGAPFDLLVNLTDMQEHERLNMQAIEARKHVWSEKPIANSLDAGQKILATAIEKGVHIWAAPAMVASPQFAFMAKTLAEGTLGRLAAAHADYGHGGPNWSKFFYEEGGGSLPDLAVYNLTTLTGLLGPAKSVVAMTSVITPTRDIRDIGEIHVVAEDNAMLLMEHAAGVISHVQSGFSYFNPRGHDGEKEQRHTIRINGHSGYMGLVGYDWDPHGVDVATREAPAQKRFVPDKGAFLWEMGASLAAESLATNKPLLITPEHALHVLEVIQATRESQATGRRVPLTSTFKWPIVS